MKSASCTSAFRASAMRFSMELAILSRARFASSSAIWKILRRSVSTSPRMGSRPPTVSLKRPMRRLKHVEHPLLDGACHGEVEDGYDLFLSEAVHAPYALLYAHRVPGQVVVDE